MPSYLEREQLQQVPPYIANTSAILNTFNTKLQYWASGAARVKSAYDKYLGMDLTRDDNQSSLKNFMQGAKSQMQKTIHTDLSVGDNQAAALSIFDPLTNGQTQFSKNILGDNAVTKHYQNQLQIANSYRTKDNGKGYSNTNVAYLTQHLNDFANEQSADSWHKYYAEKRQYSPYYDYHKEIKELMDSYKPSSMSKTEPTSSLYFHTIEDKSTTSDDARRYINANLSNEAREQMKIESSVSWHDRDNDLIQSVGAQWQSDVAKYNSYAKSLEAEIRVEKDPAKKAQLEGEKALVQKRVSNINDNLGKYSKGDYTEIMNNKDTYANNLYTDNMLNAIATGWARTDYTEKYSPDQAAIQTMLETGRNLREVSRQTFDAGENAKDRVLQLQIAQLRADKEDKDTPGNPKFALPKPGDANTTVPLTEADKKTINLSLGTLATDKSAQDATQQQAYSTIFDRLAARGMVNKVDDDEQKVMIAKNYIKAMDAAYQKYSSDPRTAPFARDLMEQDFFPGVMETIGQIQESNQKLYAINSVKERLSEQMKGEVKALADAGELTVDFVDKNGQSTQLAISPEVAMNFFVKGDESVIKTGLEGWGSLGPGGNGQVISPGDDMSTMEAVMPTGGTNVIYTYNGRQISASQIDKLRNKINNLIEKKYDETKVENKTVWSFGPNSKVRLDVAKKDIIGRVTHDDKELKEGDFQVTGYDEQGNLYFKGDGKIKGADEIAKDADGRYTYKVNSPSFKIEGNYNIPPSASGVKYFLDKQTPFLKPGQTISTPVDQNFFQIGSVQYRVEAQKLPDLSTVYNIYEKSAGNNQGKFLKSFNDFYSLAEFAETYPQAKTVIK